MTDTLAIEPAGATRFQAVSYPNPPAKAVTQATPLPPAPKTVEERLKALEGMVHEIALHTLSASTHPGVVAWMRGIGARIKNDLEKVF